MLKIDIGCGGKKREGFVGLDRVAGPEVDHVLDLERDPFPFANDSVDHAYSSHFLEYLKSPRPILSEIGRVCRDGAAIEIWTPYAFSNHAFVQGHEFFLTELLWQRICITNRKFYATRVGGRWLLKEIRFVLPQHTLDELNDLGVSPVFAIKYLKNVVLEFGAFMEHRSDPKATGPKPVYSYATERWGPTTPFDLHSLQDLRFGTPQQVGPLQRIGRALDRRLKRVIG